MKKALITISLIAVGLAVSVGRDTLFLARDIRHQSTLDEARSADVILVLGAAEYRGKPSPIFKARLNHALFLYLQHLAPRVWTTGGAGGDPTFTEGEVAHAYLTQHGVPSEAVFVEKEATNTVESTDAAIALMRKNNWRSCIVVSDGYHVYRIKKMLERVGLEAYGSPRPTDREILSSWIYVRQAIAYQLWRVGFST